MSSTEVPLIPPPSNPISIPGPSFYITPDLLKKGIYSSLITDIKSIPSPFPSDTTQTTQQTTDQWFDAPHPIYPLWGATFGGVFVAQAVSCGLLSLEKPSEYYICSLQSLFLARGKEGANIQYKVHFIKISKSFINIEVEAYQDLKLLYTAYITFTRKEPTTLQHTYSPYNIDFEALPHPDTIPLFNQDIHELSMHAKLISNPAQQKLVLAAARTIPICTKVILRDDLDIKYHIGVNSHPRPPRQLLYIRFPQTPYDLFNVTPELETKLQPRNNINDETTTINDETIISITQQLNLIALAYTSDYNIIHMLIRPHNTLDSYPLNIQFSSLTHNITFLTPNIDLFNDWLIFDAAAPFLINSRGKLIGTFYTRDGIAVAQVEQEALCRVREGNVVDKFPNPMQVGVKMAERVREKHGGKMPGVFGIDMEKNKVLYSRL